MASLVPIIEATTFVVTHSTGGADWKDGCFRDAPFVVKAVMGNGLRNPLGLFAALGLFFLPLWLWILRVRPRGVPSIILSPNLGFFLVLGRLLASMVEGWIILRYVLSILNQDARDLEKRRTAAKTAAGE